MTGEREVRYRGTTKKGHRVSGSMRTSDLPAWVEKKYQQGYRYLEVTEDGVQVAGISVLDGTWWKGAD